MKPNSLKGLAALLCTLAIPAAHAASSTITLDFSQLVMTELDPGTSVTSLGFGGFTPRTGLTAHPPLSTAVRTANSLSTFATPGSGEDTYITGSFNGLSTPITLATTVGSIYSVTLPYTISVNASNALDQAANGHIQLDVITGIQYTSSYIELNAVVGQAAKSASGTLELLFEAQASSSNFYLYAVSSASAISSPVPESNTAALALAGVAVAASVARRRQPKA